MSKTLYLTSIILMLSAFCSYAQCTSPPIQPSSITGMDPVCAGSSQTFTINPVPGADDYTWVLPSGWTGTSTSTTITVTVGTGGGWMYVYANNQCGTSTPQGFFSVVMEANVTANTATSFCAGGSVVLHANDNTGSGIYYQWYKDGVQIPGATTDNYTATASGSYHVTIASNNCQAVSGPMTVTVEPFPATPTATNNSPTCLGTMLNFTGTCATPGVTYNWTGPNTFSNTQNPVIGDAHPQDAGVYTLTVVTGAGCTSSTTTTVVMKAAPAAPAIIAGPDHICEGEGASYNVLNDANVDQYNWNIPTSWTGTSTTNMINVTAGNAGGTVSVSAENVCGISTAAAKNVIINPHPVPVVMQMGNTLSTTQTFSTYQWYIGLTPIAGATSQTFMPTQNGIYFVFVINSYGCSGQSAVFNYVPVNVQGVDENRTVSLYPSPNSGNFSVNGFAHDNEAVSAQVTDMTGRMVYDKETNGRDLKIAMDASLPAGAYVLKLMSGVDRVIIPFVKQ